MRWSGWIPATLSLTTAIDAGPGRSHNVRVWDGGRLGCCPTLTVSWPASGSSPAAFHSACAALPSSVPVQLATACAGSNVW